LDAATTSASQKQQAPLLAEARRALRVAAIYHKFLSRNLLATNLSFGCMVD
jgi:hypothetical protein